jgi:metal-sulfur cluster biosynthetic enzyme
MQSDKETNLNSRDYDAVDSDAVSLERRVRSNLRRVIDPEIGINIVDLGLVYDISINEENDAQVTMTLTAPNCPFGDMIMTESEFAIRSTEGVNLIKLNLTFDPPWNPDIHVSEEAKYQMGIL